MADADDSSLFGGLDSVGQFIVLWFIVGGAITFGIVVFTARYQWPGIAYVVIWLAIGLLLSPMLFRGGQAEAA